MLIFNVFEYDRIIDQPKEVLERYFSSEVADSISNNRKHQRETHDLGTPDFMILFGTQDPGGVDKLRINRIPNTNKVLVIYDQNSEMDLVKMVFDTVKTNDGWKITDIEYTIRKSAISSESHFTLKESL
jgi:hypothetical protein